jgi:hypothetical protein
MSRSLGAMGALGFMKRFNNWKGWASLGTLIAAATFVVSYYDSRHASPAILDIDAIDVRTSAAPGFDDRFPIIDVTVRNNGKSSAHIVKVNLNVTQIWGLVRDPVAEHMDSTALYDLPIDIGRKPPFVLSVAIDQQAKSGELDKFSIKLAALPFEPVEAILEARLSLQYDNEHLTSERKLVFVLPDFSDHPPTYFYSQWRRRMDDLRREVQAGNLPSGPYTRELLSPEAEQAYKDDGAYNTKILLKIRATPDVDAWSTRIQTLIAQAEKESSE